ncbi:MAG: hemerythrin domain-containing protein [Nitrospirales bacterium]|nr:hemerythrin domain-containing protein [Nitrospirales bacterium]MBA3965584.1 hemerythrin domain-containing protein [Nitrospirales bacterium]
MDIYQALKEDHQEAKKLFAEIEQSSGKTNDSREKLFTTLKEALENHSQAEEKVFYAPLKKKEETKDKIEHAKKEHQKVTKMLNELESMDNKDDQWLKKVSQLKEDVQHHIQEEEGEIFKKAQGIFSKEQAEEMARQFKQAKKQKA